MGVVWYGMVQSGMVWSGVVRYGNSWMYFKGLHCRIAYNYENVNECMLVRGSVCAKIKLSHFSSHSNNIIQSTTSESMQFDTLS